MTIDTSSEMGFGCLDGESRNYFDVEKEFFLIDSDNLQNVETRLYGYSVQESGIYENDNLTEAAVSELDGCGAYIYVEVKNRKIKIQQDFNGSYGIYLYRNGDYFALSNSFLRLLEYVKSRFPVSLNRDYANHLLTQWLVNSIAYSETLIQEITTLDKDTFIEIDVQKKTFVLKMHDYKEASIRLNSAEGIEVLDRWFLRWTNIFRNLKEKTDQIMIDLSGGFDSRTIFLLMLQSGINLDEICVRSIDDTLHTHKEDYEIASEIADYYGFKLNKNILRDSSLPYSMEDILNISFYTKLGIHKEMYFGYSKNEWKRYWITGKGGEIVRAYWKVSAQEFKDKMCGGISKYPKSIQNDMVKSIHGLIDSSYEIIKKKHRIIDDNSIDYPLYMYREIRNRGHFGKWFVEDYFSNNYDLSPFIDPALLKLQLSDDECQDNDFLMAMIYVRYCPELLDFKFEGGRTIDPATIEFAQKIDEKFEKPFCDTKVENRAFHVNVKDTEVSKLKSDTENPLIAEGVPEKYLKSVFDSTGLRKLFATCFDEEIYRQANIFLEKNNYYPMRHCYSIIAVTKVIEDVIASQNNLASAPVQSMDRFLCENYYKAEKDREVIECFKDHITARIDFKLYGVENPDLEIVSISDSRAGITMPEFLQEDGIGYKVESYAGSMDLTFRSATGGNLKIWERGRDVHDGEDNKVAYWINYQNVQYDDNIISEAQGRASHDSPICLTYPVEAGKIIHFHVEWMPCRADYKAYGDLTEYIRNHITARMDFELSGVENPDLEIVSISDSRAGISKPEFLQKDGIGYKIESCAGSIKIILHSDTGGSLKIWERSRDVRDEEDNRIDYWINYQNVSYNDNIISKGQGLAWHDRPICLNYPVEAGETIRFRAEWMPYRGDYRHIEKIEKQANEIKELQNEINDIKNSNTFRIGSKVMYIPRKIKGWFEN